MFKKTLFMLLLTFTLSAIANAQNVAKFTPQGSSNSQYFTTMAAAITHLNTVGAGTLEILQNTTLTQTIPLKAGMTLKGSATVTFSSNDPTLTFVKVLGSNVTIRDLWFTRTVDPVSGNGIEINAGISNVTVDNCHLIKHYYGVKATAGNSSGIFIKATDFHEGNYYAVFLNASNITLTDVVGSNAQKRGYGFHNVSGIITLTDVRSFFSENNGLYIENSKPTSMNIIGGDFDYSGVQSVLIVGSENVTFTETCMDRSGGYNPGGVSSTSGYSVLEIVSSKNITVNQNLQDGIGIYYGASHGVYVKNSSFVTLKKLRVYDNSLGRRGGAGIYIENSTNMTIEGNDISCNRNPAATIYHQSYGIYIAGTCTGIIRNNTAYGYFMAPFNGNHCYGDYIIEVPTLSAGGMTFTGNSPTFYTSAPLPKHQH